MAKTPHFFRIILADSVQQGRLVIPKSFVRRYGNHLSRTAFLKVPNGAKWQVDLVKNGDDVWFGNGWRPFADHYSVSYGTFLVVGFEDFKTCTFNVFIFDNTTSEINYPFHPQEEDHEEPDHLEEQVDDSPINIEESIDVDVLPTRISKGKSPMPSSSSPCKEKKKQEHNRTQSEVLNFKAKRVNGATTSYKSENPSFSIVMQPSHINTRRLNIPASFANEYFTQQRGAVTLNSVDGKQTWSVEYCSYYKGKTKIRITLIICGWSKFVKENQLAIGDVCVFELMNPNALGFKVVIRRKNPDAAKSIPSIGNTKQLNYKEMSSLMDFTSDNPYFQVTIHKSYLEHGLMNVPSKFMTKYKNQMESVENAVLQVGNEVWPVKLVSHPSTDAVKFSAGFGAFVHDNSLHLEDVCIFELINGETMLFKVSIFRNP